MLAGILHPKLANYQAEAAGWLLLEPNRLLADDLGVGKTFECIAACDLLNLRRILIVCPGIARGNWLEELTKWQTVRRSATALMSSNDNASTTDVVVVSYSLLRSLPVLKALLARHWDSLILDECHYGKSNDAWRTKAIYGMRCDGANGLVSVADRVWLLSGTPMPNNPSELWTHCNALFPDVSQGFGFNRFVDEYCVKDPFSGRIVRSKNREKLAALLKPHVLRRLAKDVLPQLPPLRFSHIPVYPDKLPPMSSELKETAAVVKAAMEAMGTGPEAAQRSRAQLAKLDQGSIASLRKWTGTAKAPAIVEYVKNDLASGMDRVVIFAWHREPIRIIEEGIKGAVAIHGDVSAKRREEILKEFKHGSSIPALVLQTEIGSTAINLVNAANVVFAEPSWVPKDIEQAAARLHRQGQLRPVWARLFSLQGSFDETVIRVLTRKMAFTKAFNTSITAHPA